MVLADEPTNQQAPLTNPFTNERRQCKNPSISTSSWGIVQAFEKVPILKAMAPTHTEPPFKLTQLIVLALFIVFAIAAATRFRNEAAA